MSPDERLPSRKMMEDVSSLAGPCIVWEARDWSAWGGTYKDDEAAQRDAKRVQKKRKDSVKVRADRWENYRK